MHYFTSSNADVHNILPYPRDNSQCNAMFIYAGDQSPTFTPRDFSMWLDVKKIIDTLDIQTYVVCAWCFLAANSATVYFTIYYLQPALSCGLYTYSISPGSCRVWCICIQLQSSLQLVGFNVAAATNWAEVYVDMQSFDIL